MSILRVKDDKGNIIPIPAIKGDKGDKGDRGDTGVYVGSGAVPEGCNVKIDPNGEADDLVTKAEFEELKVPSIRGNIIINKAVEDKEVYNVSENCYMMVLINIDSSSGVYVYVNGVILHHTYVSGNEMHQLSWGCYLRKGDSVQFHRDTFYPTSVGIFVYG